MLWVCQCVNFKAQIFIPGPNAEVKIDSNKGIWIWNECSQKVLYQHRISISSINRHTEHGGEGGGIILPVPHVAWPNSFSSSTLFNSSHFIREYCHMRIF